MKRNISVGIDPGDRWVGIATLCQHGDRIHGCSTVVDTKRYDTPWRTVRALDEFLAGASLIVVENFQLRLEGWNSFRSGRTLRLIGALDALCMERYKIQIKSVAPGRVGQVAKFWPHVRGDLLSTAGNRRHAASAWRVLGAHFMQHDAHLLYTFTGDQTPCK